MAKIPLNLIAASGFDSHSEAAWVTEPVWLPRVIAGLTGVACFGLLLVLILVWRRRAVPHSRAVWLFGSFVLLFGCAHLLDASGWNATTAAGALFLRGGSALAAWITLLGWTVMVLRARPAARQQESNVGMPATSRPAPL